MPYQQVNPVINYSVRGLCTKSYYNHKKGCPNFNKKDGCPPQAMFFDKYYDLSNPVYVIWNKFDLGAHVEKLRSKYPDWSEHQLSCCLYWQPKARGVLKENIKEFLREVPGQKMTSCPEAMGVNITETMKSIGIELEWPPKKFTYQVAMAGTLLSTVRDSCL